MIGKIVAAVLVLLTGCSYQDQKNNSDVTVASTYSSIRENIIVPKCLSCHNTSNASKGKDYSTYAQVMATGSIVAAAPTQSSFYNQIRTGAMPKGGPSLSAQAVQAVSDWIQAGAAAEN